ncbi:hypothetical protein [Lepagella muris]|jgi:hypothetical protein|nr:hypothetical protein [Lepagella muris]
MAKNKIEKFVENQCRTNTAKEATKIFAKAFLGTTLTVIGGLLMKDNK